MSRLDGIKYPLNNRLSCLVFFIYLKQILKTRNKVFPTEYVNHRFLSNYQKIITTHIYIKEGKFITILPMTYIYK